MTKYIDKDLPNIIKSDSKKIKFLKKDDNLNLTKIMNRLSTFFGYRDYNELQKIHLNLETLNNNFRKIYLMDFLEFSGFNSQYISFLKSNFIDDYNYRTFWTSQLNNIINIEEISVCYDKNPKIKFNVINKDIYFNINDYDKEYIKSICKREGVDFEKEIKPFLKNNKDSINIDSLKNRNVKFIIRNENKLNHEKIKLIITLLSIIIKENNRKKHTDSSFIELLSTQCVGSFIFSKKEDSQKKFILKKFFNNINKQYLEKKKPLIISYGFKDYFLKNNDFEYERLHHISKEKSNFKYVIKCDPDTIIWNIEDLSEENEKTLMELIESGFHIIVFIDEIYSYKDLINNNKGFIEHLSSIDYIHSI